MQFLKFPLIVLLVSSVLVAGVACADVITVRADAWPPYNDEPNSDKPGYMIEAAKLIFAAEGHEIDYQLMPWSRSLDLVEKGTYDAVVGTDSEESPKFIFPTAGFGLSQNGFFVKQGGGWSFDGIDSLRNVRLGVISGYAYYEALDKYIAADEKHDRIFVATGDDALSKLLKMLHAGRIDVLIEDINVMQQALLESQLSDIVQAGIAPEKGLLFMAFSPANKKSREYARIFDDGIVKLRSNGKLNEILSRYGLKDWQ